MDDCLETLRHSEQNKGTIPERARTASASSDCGYQPSQGLSFTTADQRDNLGRRNRETATCLRVNIDEQRGQSQRYFRVISAPTNSPCRRKQMLPGQYFTVITEPSKSTENNTINHTSEGNPQ